MLNILFEDEYLLAVNKPAGLLVVPSPQGEQKTLLSILGKIMLGRGCNGRIHPCHRLDRDTTGIVLFAKDAKTRDDMFSLFKQRAVKKSYLALVTGIPFKKTGVISKKIDGVLAITKYNILSRKQGYSVLEVEPVTGRTNQIRIHLKSIGHPVLGERKYAFGKDFTVKFKRTALHAEKVTFPHPVTGKTIYLKAAVPEDMKKML